jgi:protein-S-isoprenylcysteine O-methyltransferase Ste14
VKIPKRSARDFLEADEVLTLLVAGEIFDNPVKPETARADELVAKSSLIPPDRVAWEYRAVTEERQDRGQRDEQGGRQRDAAGVIAPPPVIFLAFLAIGFVLESALPDNNLPSWLQWFGVLPIVFGSVLLVAFERELSRARTSANPYRPTTAIVTTGPFRMSRNPAYLGMAVIYVGLALVADAPWALATLIPALLVIQLGVIAREERYLESRFGDQYLSYKRQTRRWI